MLPILEKWSSKIQAATTQVAAKGSKFLQSTKTGQDGIMEAISAGLENRVSLMLRLTR
jgi:protein AATF/BFR2